MVFANSCNKTKSEKLRGLNTFCSHCIFFSSHSLTLSHFFSHLLSYRKPVRSWIPVGRPEHFGFVLSACHLSRARRESCRRSSSALAQPERSLSARRTRPSSTRWGRGTVPGHSPAQSCYLWQRQKGIRGIFIWGPICFRSCSLELFPLRLTQVITALSSIFNPR